MRSKMLGYSLTIGCACVAMLGFWLGTLAGKGSALDTATLAQLTREKLQADMTFQQVLSDIKANKSKLDQLDDYQKKINSLKTQIAQDRVEMDQINSSLTARRTELSALTRKVEKVRSEPITLPAGYFK